jgi:adenine-specific DNA-methyltransferase
VAQSNKQRLELTWIGKDNRPRLEPRILLEDPEKSYHAKQRVTENDIFDNRLIFGDNLLALKALEQEFAGKVRCVFIDPPYNTGSAFTHYDDGVEHSIWLSLMRDRLELLRRLLSDDGSLWITIDDNEAHYLKVLCDEVFGRANFVSNVMWQKKSSPQANSVWLSDSHDHVLVYAKQKEIWRPNLLPRTDDADARYSNPDNDPRGPWTSGDFTISLTGGQRGAQFARTGVSENIFEIETPSGRKLMPTNGRCWGASPTRFAELKADNRIWFGENGNNVPRIKRFLSEVQEGIVCTTVWLRSEVGDNQDAKREVSAFNSANVFSTPKPEKLLSRIIQVSSRPGDVVLDSFAGSGTTGAVAHKMGRRWIMVELGEHCHTHIIPRLKKVIEGEDPGGVTEAIGWKGGGGFRYFHIAPSLLEKDRFGNLVISKQYNAAMLTEAMCKVMGFTYAPSDELYWQQGRSTENDFLFVTTQTLTREQLAKLSDDVGENRSLLICCAAFRGKADAFPNLTIKKIPSAVLAKCEWGHDDYSLNVANLPKAAPPPEPIPPEVAQASTPKQARRRALAAQPDLFSSEQQGGAE